MHTIFEAKPQQKVTFEELMDQSAKLLPRREELSVINYNVTYPYPMYNDPGYYGGYPNQHADSYYHTYDYRHDYTYYDYDHQPAHYSSSRYDYDCYDYQDERNIVWRGDDRYMSYNDPYVPYNSYSSYGSPYGGYTSYPYDGYYSGYYDSYRYNA